jgi:multisubunit Na+/H+ antiporter MnhE subunit
VTSGRRQRQGRTPITHRVRAWLAWWALLLAFWVVLDYSTERNEVLAGAAAAAMGAFLAELVARAAGVRLRMRARWLRPALRLPWQVVTDTAVVFAALWRRLARGEQPASGFREVPVRHGGDSAEDLTRRVLLIGGRSVAPNAFALGIDAEHDVMVVHELVGGDAGPPGRAELAGRAGT